MYTLYIFNGAWEKYAEFACEDYAEQVRCASDKKRNFGKTESEKNAASVLESFVCGGYFYPKSYAKTLLRALRHFDEVGASNEICEALETALDDGFERVALVATGESVDAYTAGDIALRI